LMGKPSTYFWIGAAILLAGLAAGLTHVLAERRKSPIAHLSKPMKLASIIPSVLGLYLVLSLREQAFAPALASNVPDTGDTPAGPMVWRKDEKSTLANALAEKKPVVIDFGASWCGACKELEHKTWPAPVVRSEGKRFEALSVDCTDDEDEKVIAIKKKYNVVGLPVVILLDSTGKEQARFTEFVEPTKMADAMCGVR
jgi:thioredoxin:protein disulfide reductase